MPAEMNQTAPAVVPKKSGIRLLGIALFFISLIAITICDYLIFKNAILNFINKHINPYAILATLAGLVIQIIQTSKLKNASIAYQAAIQATLTETRKQISQNDLSTVKSQLDHLLMCIEQSQSQAARIICHAALERLVHARQHKHQNNSSIQELISQFSLIKNEIDLQIYDKKYQIDKIEISKIITAMHIVLSELSNPTEPEGVVRT